MCTSSTFVILLVASLINYVIPTSNRRFPAHFKFGAATASYQIEGGWNVDNKSANIWDHICHINPSFVLNNDSGDIACDSYHKYEEDVAMLKELGVDFYRYSLSWSRILPYGLAGTPVNELGVAYYRNLTQLLLDNGIEPMVTIYHWDLPEVLQGIGGFPNPEFPEHFEFYAKTAFKQLGDLVKYWFTFNEPEVTCYEGYGVGTKAPGLKASGVADYKCAHNLLKAHAKAYHVYDKIFRAEQGGKVGMVVSTPWMEPASTRNEDIRAADRALQFSFGWYANPIIHGNYPQIMIDRIGKRSKQQGYPQSRLPKFRNEEIIYIKNTYDFIAVNTYTSLLAEWKDEADVNDVSTSSDLNVNLFYNKSWEPSASDWLKVTPWGIRKLVNWVSKTYGNQEIFITENGFSDRGGLQDDRRINYYREYLSNLLEAILDDGINVTRYTAWSLMDNFEWRQGYTEKFGLYSVDFNDPHRPRTKKDSAKYYSNVIRTRCLVDSCV